MCVCAQFQRRRFAEELRRRWVPRWAGLQLARAGALLTAWRDRLAVKEAFKVCAGYLLYTRFSDVGGR